MISFACKQCGKRHDRPDEAAGTMVFCECGCGNRVPWESTLPPAEVPTLPEAEPVPPSRPRSREESRVPERERPRRRQRWRTPPPEDPNHCLNHPESPSKWTCAACQAAFCEDCVVVFQGETLCGPCKNFRIQHRQRPSQLSIMALFSLIVSIVGGPVGFVIMSMAVGLKSPDMGWVGLAPELVGLGLGGLALRHIETQPRLSGRALAISGIVAALAGMVLMGSLLYALQRNLV